MQQLFLLLRNNQQTGPYSIEELLQLNLKPFDLVWVEGRSAAWQYPEEIPALHPYVPSTPRPEPFSPITTAAMENSQPVQEITSRDQQGAPSAKHVFVSMPRKQQAFPPLPPEPDSVPVEEKVQATPERFYEPTFQTKIAAPVEDYGYEKAYAAEYRMKKAGRKKVQVSGKDLVVASLIVVVIAAGYYLISRPSVITKRAVPVVVKELPAEPARDSSRVVAEAIAGDPHLQAKTESWPEPKMKWPKESISKEKKQEAIRPASIPSATASVHNEEILKETSGTTAETKKPEATSSREQAPQKKKKLGEVIKNIFTKNKKEPGKTTDPTVLDEPRPATNRQSTKRSDDEANSKTVTAPKENKEEDHDVAAPEPNLADLVDLSSNAPASWMMGVTGLKITLRNRSNSTIQTAAVNVFYYDDNNRLLDKKMIYFSNVPAKGKLTLPAPDHKFADHVEFKLGAVSAKEDRFAKG